MKWSVLQGMAEAGQSDQEKIGRVVLPGWGGRKWFAKLEDQIGFKLCEKCGLHTMINILAPRGFGSYTELSPSPRTSVFVCRNPYERMVSVWWGVVHIEWRANRERIERIGSDDFGSFVRWITDPHLQEIRSIFRTQNDWIGDSAITHVVHLENLKSELEPFFGKIETPHLNATAEVREPWRSYYDDDSLARTRKWAFEDCRRFGYNPDP